MPHAIISLGSNIDKEHNLPRAVALLAAATNVLAVSSVYETIPVGLRDQANFFNAAVLIETGDTPASLKAGLLTDIERELKRVRQADKNAPRTIDLDISWYDDAGLAYDGPDGRPRRVPDPDLLRFVHVALPLTELLPPGATHPDTGEAVQLIAERLQRAAVLDGTPTIWLRDDIDLSSRITATQFPAASG
jgi:2-amino-4-hydroxy-6-hydroxymethyldihydropteridine diphosphokinase